MGCLCSGGVHTDLGHVVRLPLAQGVRRPHQIHQGVRQDGMGTHQSGIIHANNPKNISLFLPAGAHRILCQ